MYPTMTPEVGLAPSPSVSSAGSSNAATDANFSAMYPTAVSEPPVAPAKLEATPDAAKAQLMYQSDAELQAEASRDKTFDLAINEREMPNVPVEHRATLVTATRALAAEVGASAAEAAAFVAEVRGVNAAPPTAAQVGEWSRESADWLMRAHRTDYTERLSDVQTLLAANPKLALVVGKNSIQEKPAVFKTLVEIAWRARAAGKFSK